MRTSSSPARPRMRRQGCCRSVRCQPGLRPAITHGLSSSRGREVSNRTAEGARGTTRPPVLVSGNLSSPASRSTCSQRSFLDFRQPAAGQHQETDRGYRRAGLRSVPQNLVENLAKPV